MGGNRKEERGEGICGSFHRQWVFIPIKCLWNMHSLLYLFELKENGVCGCLFFFF